MTQLGILKSGAVAILQQAGIANPLRLSKLIRDAIAFFNLDLSGLTVLTEAASAPYVVTPAIAALAGAQRVIAITRNSEHASAESVISQTRALEQLCGSPKVVEIYPQRDLELFSKADIVTNLGFVRPIDAEAISFMKPTAVVPLMCEAWEYRPEDVDVAACKAKGIEVLGTNEDFPGLEVFAYCGWLCLKMLFDAQIEVHKSRTLVVGNDKFAPVIHDQLTRSGGHSEHCRSLSDIPVEKLRETDAIVLADYTRQDEIIGQNGDISADELAEKTNRRVCVVQFAGAIDVQELKSAGIAVYPGIELPPRRMAKTLSYLGSRPVVELHAAGLKVGELGVRARVIGMASEKSDPFEDRHASLIQIVELGNGK